jgi:hypothetical protein
MRLTRVRGGAWPLAFLAVLFLTLPDSPAFAQQRGPRVSSDASWLIDSSIAVPARARAERVMPRRYQMAAMDNSRLRARLARVQVREVPDAELETQTVLADVMELPMPDGTFTRLHVWEDPIFSPEMQARYPHIRTYAGVGIDDPTMTARIDETPRGFHAQLIGEDGTTLIEPLDRDAGLYMAFWKHDAERTGDFECGVSDDPLHALRDEGFQILLNPVGGQRRTYRLRIVTTFNYTNFFGGVDDAVAAVATTINRVNGIYEREVSIRFTLVSTDALTGNTTDGGDAVGACAYPFANVPAVNSAFLTQNNNFLECRYGASGWDIGHVFGRGGGGGLAELGSVCGANKGRGGTQLDNPSGDVFDVDYVSHEIGHQINADHTFNGTSGSCSGNREAASAYEPGSGSTIMAYAGICSGQNVQNNSSDYFHARSIQQMTDYAFVSGGLCGTLSNTSNSPPNVNAGPNYTIPRDTPFRLTATGSDPDGQAVTFNWEQYDLGPAAGVPSGTQTSGPLFRSRPPTTSPTRTLPRLQDIMIPPSTSWEVLPQVDRDMTFRVTARDGLGGVRHDTMAVFVSGAPFEVTYPAFVSNVECGLPVDVTWNVGGGSIAPNVSMSLSLDDGSTFSTLLASTPNDGAETVNFPNTPVLSDTVAGTGGRVMLDSIGNIFFAVSRSFNIRDTLPPAVTAPANIVAECTSPAGTPVLLGMGSANDVCAGPLPVSNNAPALFPVGTTQVTWSATDPSGNTGNAFQTVTIEDTIPPVLEVSVSPTILWPPNHRMVRISADIFVEDVCDGAPTVRLVSITSNEPDNGIGDGNTSGDVQAVFDEDTREFFLRAERSGQGNGRVYTITYEASDGSGNTTVRSVQVLVPRDYRP